MLGIALAVLLICAGIAYAMLCTPLGLMLVFLAQH